MASSIISVQQWSNEIPLEGGLVSVGTLPDLVLGENKDGGTIYTMLLKSIVSKLELSAVIFSNFTSRTPYSVSKNKQTVRPYIL